MALAKLCWHPNLALKLSKNKALESGDRKALSVKRGRPKVLQKFQLFNYPNLSLTTLTGKVYCANM